LRSKCFTDTLELSFHISKQLNMKTTDYIINPLLPYSPLFIILLIIENIAFGQSPQKLAAFIEKSGRKARESTPISTPLQALPLQSENFSLDLYEVRGENRKQVQAQNWGRAMKLLDT